MKPLFQSKIRFLLPVCLLLLILALFLCSSRNPGTVSLEGQFQSAVYPDDTSYTAEFHKDTFHIQYHWAGHSNTVLSGLFEPVDKKNGIYLLHDSERNRMEVITITANGFYLIDRELNDMLIFFQPEA